ncbi:hypothetical protein IQ06DRAFT_304627 [Phaeosphaeriaceae sp. SRC1lsM3a]|nr:hypothetical protein IQ06DRAFT_304627 [Stagonospora sp. SRC1lsM3a]
MSAHLHTRILTRPSQDPAVSQRNASSRRMGERTREEHRSLPAPVSHISRPVTRLRPAVAAPMRPVQSFSPPKDPLSTYVTESLVPGGATDGNDTADFYARLEDEQENLRDARENLLGSRVRLQVQRQELLNTREKASSQAGAVFERVRRLLIDIGVQLPDEVELAFSELELSRNELGIQEVDYDEAEKAYNVDEWAYTRKESDFMQDLCRGAPARSQTASLRPSNDYMDVATRFSYGPQDIERIVAESEGDLPIESYEGNMTLLDEDDFSEGQDTVPGDFYKQLSASGSQGTDPTTHTTAAEAVEFFLSDKHGHSHERVRWVGTRRSVDEWLLNTLKVSHFEQARLQVWLSSYTDNEDWWEFVDRNWFLDTSEFSKYHTGDTTIPEEDLISNPTAFNHLGNTDGLSETSETAEQKFSAVPLLAQDRVMDALESIDFPTIIEPQDLIEAWPHDTKPWPPPSQNRRSTSSSTRLEVGKIGNMSVPNEAEQQEPFPPPEDFATKHYDTNKENVISEVVDHTNSGHDSPVDQLTSNKLSSLKSASLSPPFGENTDSPLHITSFDHQTQSQDTRQVESVEGLSISSGSPKTQEIAPNLARHDILR